MITKDIVLISALVALAAGQALAYPLSYGPFETNQAPASVPIHQRDLIQQTGTPKTPPNWGTDDGVAGMTRLYRDKQQPRWSVQLIGTTNGRLIQLLDGVELPTAKLFFLKNIVISIPRFSSVEYSRLTSMDSSALNTIAVEDAWVSDSRQRI